MDHQPSFVRHYGSLDQGAAAMLTHRRVRGFTLVEVLVVVSIVGMLVAITLPAVMRARAAAWRAGCASNLRQISIAIHSYVSSFETFPPPYLPPIRRTTGVPRKPLSKRCFSVFSMLVPYMGETSLYHSINFSVYMDDPYLSRSNGESWTGFVNNQTAMNTQIGVLICPADRTPGTQGCVNYRASLGTERWYFSTDGPFMNEFTLCRPSAVTDGLSNTVALSEKLRGRADGYGMSPGSDMFLGAQGLPYTVDEVVSVCSVPRTNASPRSSATGLNWMVGRLSQTCYNHTLTPNSAVFDCVSWTGNPTNGLIGARSDHENGVNALVADGSVRFVTSSIERTIWRALGSRASSDLVGSY